MLITSLMHIASAKYGLHWIIKACVCDAPPPLPAPHPRASLMSHIWGPATHYGLWRRLYADMAGPETFEKYKTPIYLAGSASAEFFADIGLCAFEAVKVHAPAVPSVRPAPPVPVTAA